ncbi:MAG: hypothetical protein JST04_18200 [Bdellovibrionales bacterium]|nr:hypothetical protein [Bdellovibrionales bacterium]
MKKTSVLVLGVLAFTAYPSTVRPALAGECTELAKKSVASETKVRYQQEKIKKGVDVIEMGGDAKESPVVNAEGTKVLVNGSQWSDKMPPTELYMKDLTNPADMGKRIKKPLLNIFVKGSFAPNGDVIACELEYRFGAIIKTTWDFFQTGEWEPRGYHSVISVYRDGEKLATYDAASFGLPKGTFLEHPRVSPDGKLMTFYTQSSKDVQGIYVYRFESGTTIKGPQTYYMGNHLYKHPTWGTRPGRKFPSIFFHEQGEIAETGEEIARIGYVDIDVVNGEVRFGEPVFVTGKDAKFGQFGSTYIYDKHPAYHSGLNMVFFHSKDGLTGKKGIGVISLDHPDHDPLFIKLSDEDEVKYTHAQHVDVSDRPDSPLYFVARVKGEKKARLLTIDFDRLAKLRKEFEN